jgi:light-regulated signal transduction histidine kinase (bacteriophytochrome)
MRHAISTITTVIAFLVAGQANAWTTTQEAANRLGAAQFREINFSKNISELSEMQKTELKQAIMESEQKGQIEEVKILAWSDQEYPSENSKQSKSEIKLASQRVRQLKAFIKDDLKISNVGTYNMSKRPNDLQKLFNTADRKIKDTVASAGAAPTEGNTGLFETKAQASKGVVMIFMKK